MLYLRKKITISRGKNSSDFVTDIIFHLLTKNLYMIQKKQRRKPHRPEQTQFSLQFYQFYFQIPQCVVVGRVPVHNCCVFLENRPLSHYATPLFCRMNFIILTSASSEIAMFSSGLAVFFPQTGWLKRQDYFPTRTGEGGHRDKATWRMGSRSALFHRQVKIGLVFFTIIPGHFNVLSKDSLRPTCVLMHQNSNYLEFSQQSQFIFVIIILMCR